MIIIYIILLFLLLLLLAEKLRRLPLKTAIWFWAAAPILLLPLWLHNSENWDWFLWAKTYSVLIPCLLLFVLRNNQLLSDRVIGWGWFILYTLNILEAVAFDVSSGNYINALLGVALILSMPSRHTIQIEYGLKESNLSLTSPSLGFWPIRSGILALYMGIGRVLLRRNLLLFLPRLYLLLGVLAGAIGPKPEQLHLGYS